MGDYGSGASTAAEAATNTGSVADMASSIGGYSSTVGESAGSYTPAVFDTGAGVSNTPVDGTFVSYTPNQSANVAQYGTPDPSWLDKFSEGYSKFEKGQDANMAQAWREKAWDNPGTYGYIYGKLNTAKSLGGGGGSSPAPIPINTTINNAPMSEYERYVRMYGRK